jgi:hypothetical protein
LCSVPKCDASGCNVCDEQTGLCRYTCESPDICHLGTCCLPLDEPCDVAFPGECCHGGSYPANDCRPFTPGGQGYCRPCTPRGETCNSLSLCCRPNRCINGTCQFQCVNKGDPCTENVDTCCGFPGKCVNGTCA